MSYLKSSDFIMLAYANWKKNQENIDLSDLELKVNIKHRWLLLYDKFKNGEISSQEYAKRRRTYENMIEELGGLLTDFTNYLEKNTMETTKSLKNLITKSDIVYFNGKTVKDKNFKEEYPEFNLHNCNEDRVKIDFYDGNNKILSLKSRY